MGWEIAPAVVAMTPVWFACAQTIAFGQLQATGLSSQADQPAAIVAERIFKEGPETYQGVPYFWTAKYTLNLIVPTRPKSSHRLEFLWGSKQDDRTAVIEVNGKKLNVAAGGYDGFRWLALCDFVPQEAKQYEIKVMAGRGKAAFLAGVRLVELLDDAAAQSHRKGLPAPLEISLRVGPPEFPAAFAEWRNFWDRPSARKPLAKAPDPGVEQLFNQAEFNARRAHEQFFRCRKYLLGWLSKADPKTGLIPENLRAEGAAWTPENAAADNYPFMVLTAALLDRGLFEGKCREMLETERELTNRLDRLPDAYSLKDQRFLRKEIDLGRVIFGASEYVKDGLLPLTEWLGVSPWSARLIEIVDDLWKHAPVETKWGRIPSVNEEVNGEQLQTLCRVYWMTGDRRYLEWAIRLGDFYLLGERHPTRHLTQLRLRDHGCEIVSGLSELYLTVHFAAPEKKVAYRDAIYAMYHRILEVGRDSRGMLYNWINPQTGEHDQGICDTWGYNYNGIYTVWMIDKHEPFRQAVRDVLSHLPGLVDYHWGIADEYADSLEGALNLYNRERVPEAATWIESEIHDMWRPQDESGIIEGWHGDGNVARTALMYALWKTQGVTIHPWREDLLVGAVEEAGRLYLVVSAGEQPWTGKIVFDRPRHKDYLRLPVDYPRINQFPEWFTVCADRKYFVRHLGGKEAETVGGGTLQTGLEITIPAHTELRLIVEEAQ
ncbi:MAG: hypothetical protein RMJ16_00255 [Thermoguttaceae bacterium]|nr:hypothetical protein [Thermoguttaceae bacterium]